MTAHLSLRSLCLVRTNCQFGQLTLCHQLLLISGRRKQAIVWPQSPSSTIVRSSDVTANDDRVKVHCRIIFFLFFIMSIGQCVCVCVLACSDVCSTGNNSSPDTAADHHCWPLETIVLIMARCLVMTVTNWCWQIWWRRRQWRNASSLVGASYLEINEPTSCHVMQWKSQKNGLC